MEKKDNNLNYFAAQDEKRKKKLLSDKIDQINDKLRINDKGRHIIKKDQLLSQSDPASGGITFHILLFFEKQIEYNNLRSIDPNEIIFNNIRIESERYLNLAKYNKELTFSTLFHLLNSELPKAFSLNIDDFKTTSGDISLDWIRLFIEGVTNARKFLIQSLFKKKNLLTNIDDLKVNNKYELYSNEINSLIKTKNHIPKQGLSKNFLQSLSGHFKEKEIKSSVISLKNIIIEENKLHSFYNLNLLLFSILWYSDKEYNAIPIIMREVEIKRLIIYLNKKLKKKDCKQINTENIINFEKNNDYSGKSFIYLNAIFSSIKKDDFKTANEIASRNPDVFILSLRDNSGSGYNNIGFVRNNLSDLKSIATSFKLPEIGNILSNNSTDNEDPNKRKMKKKGYRRSI